MPVYRGYYYPTYHYPVYRSYYVYPTYYPTYTSYYYTTPVYSGYYYAPAPVVTPGGVSYYGYVSW